jgi:hypothetical protein
MTRRGLVTAIMLVHVGGAGAYLALRSADGGAVGGGPLGPPRDAGYFSVGGATDPGRAMSFGLLVVENGSERTATLEAVELARATAGMRIVGSYAQPVRAGPAVGFVNGFPPANATRARSAVAGYRLAPGTEVRIVVGLTVERSGRFVSRALRLSYRVGDDRYRADWPLGVRLCAPRRQYFGHCRAPTG